ncbi:Methyltransferase domain-containing protein [Chitinophaga sp. CF118]|uniref:class I SAM-dependent methyltransferase n=1 Tax=Chitinophaga sp. CF118 TaxID=1884367 RepID=UPI0008EF510B|nr:class I SAM-dependent methyltransferase [Chitinophaga sp. CF118]SFD15156.1 Methyltransferase domain-containing protein [Chitinophaga sp. CF118]
MDAKALWDDRFKKGLSSLVKPDPFFITMYEQHISNTYPSGGKVLDLAAGIGRHTLYLANRQWQPTAVDISAVAIDQLKEAAASLHVHVDTFILDVAHYHLQPESFDLIILYYHFDRALFPEIFKALKPEGLFICKLAVSKPTDLQVENMPLQKDELLSLVSSFDLISHTERPVKDRGVVEYLGRKRVPDF